VSESEFHYVRTTGVDGGVDAVDGRAIGVDLETILKDGLPPFKVALEIIAALCEILDISDQDGEVHGDVVPGTIFLDDTGAVSVEGFGIDRDSSTAPEDRPDGTLTDLYGLGYVAYRLLATRDLTGLPDDPDGHDDTVIDAVIALPWGDMPEEWVGDIQWFLAKLMSYEPEERPTAVDAWRTFIAFADEAEGVSLVDWAPDAIEGGGERRDAAMAVRPATDESEDLGGPVVSSGPLKKGAISFGGGGAKSGQATAFWSKEQMKAALEADEEEEEEAAPAFKPSVGGGAATSFWTRDQMEAMARGDDSAPRPKRKEGGGRKKPPPPAAAPGAYGPPGASSPAAELAGGVSKPSTPPPAQQATPANPPPVASPPPAAQAPSAAPPPGASAPAAAAGPAIASAPGIQPGPGMQADDDGDEGGGGGMKFAVIGVVVVLLLLTCVGVAGAIGVGAMFMGGSGESADSSDSSSSSSASDQDDDDADEDRAAGSVMGAGEDTAVDEAQPDDEPEDKPEAKPEPKPDPKPTTRGSTTTRSSGRSSSRSSSRRGPSGNRSSGGSTPRASGPTSVVFTVPGDGSIKCGDGTSKDASGGKARITFRSVPADGITCTYYDGSKPVCAGFVEPGQRKCACDPNAAEITCN